MHMNMPCGACLSVPASLDAVSSGFLHVVAKDTTMHCEERVYSTLSKERYILEAPAKIIGLMQSFLKCESIETSSCICNGTYNYSLSLKMKS